MSVKTGAPRSDLPDHSGVLTIAEANDGRLTPAFLEVLAYGKTLSRELGQPLSAAVLESKSSSITRDISTVVDQVYLAADPLFDEIHVESWVHAIEHISEISSPAVILLTSSLDSRDIAPRLALRLDTGVVTNCEELRVDRETGEVEAICSVFGGAALATYRFDEARPCVVSMRPGVAQPLSLPEDGQGEIIQVQPDLTGVLRRSEILERTAPVGPRLEDTEVIVAGGKGLKGPENFIFIQELAEVLEGMPAASRAIVDLGWATPAQQVGLTGKVVSPDLYIAVGISGASQHMVGCSSARNIVAINTDKDAPIFQHARYGVVADCVEFMPAFIERCRELGPR